MENNTPPISKTAGFLRILFLLLCFVSFAYGLVLILIPTINVFVCIAVIIGSLVSYLLVDGMNFLIKELKEYQVIKVTTQSEGIDSVITDNVSFSVQQRIFNIRTYEFEWDTIEVSLTEKEARTIVDNKFVKLKEPVIEVVYKKP